MKKLAKTILLIAIYAISTFNLSAQKGISCDSAEVLTYPINTTVTSYTSDVYWLKVTLNTGDFNIKVTNYPGIGKIVRGSVYSGTCTSLSLVGTDSLHTPTDTAFNINIHNDINGAIYYVKLFNRGGSITFNQIMASNVYIVGQVGFCPGQQITLNAYPSNANGAQTYTWQPGNLNTGSITFIPSNTISPTTYTLTYHDSGGTLTTTVNIFPLTPAQCKNCEQVQNGHFEWYNSNPIAPYTTNSAQYYFNPNTYATPDYINGLGTAFTPAPNSGNAYAGIYIYNANGPYSWREYLQNQLKCALVPGQKYDVSFYARLSPLSYKASNHIGAYLSQNLIVSNVTPVNNLNYTPQVDRTTVLNYSGTSTWTQISGTITGNNEQYITIGNFYNNANTTTVTSTSSSTDMIDAAYYHIDDISVTPVTPTLSASTNTVNCNSATTITLTSIGSSSVYTTWTDGITTYSGSIVNVPTPTTTTTYTCNVNLPCSTCLPIIQTITITFNNNLNLTASANPSAICAGQSSTLTASGASTYTWSTGATSPSIVVTPSVSTIYTVTGANSNCTATQTVLVAISGQYCCQSPIFTIGTASLSNTNYASNSNGGGSVIDILGTITFTANSNMSNYIIRMAPTASININTGVTVTFSNCTIFSCTQLWGGIFIKDGVGTPGTINILNSRLEDMYMGIVHKGQNGSATGSANFINVSNSVLNNNYISIQLRNYPRANATNGRQGLSVTGSTISSQYSSTSPQNTLKSSSTYTYEYNNISNTSIPYVNFPRGIAGIYLYNLEEIPVIVGDSTGTAGTNRFENLDFGIYGENASIKAFNNHFISITGSAKHYILGGFPPPPPPAGPDEIGVGIYAIVTSSENPYWFRVGKVAGTTTPTSGNPFPSGNKFEDCNKGIAVNNYKEPFIKGNVFTTANTSIPPSITPSTLYSYYKAQSGVYIKEIKCNATVSYNYVLNHSSGVYTSHNINTSFGLPNFVKIENNLVEAPGTNGYCRQAIQVEQPLSTVNLGTGLLTVKNNTLQNVYNGIKAYNVKGGLQINDNPTINLSASKMLGVPGITNAQKYNYARTGIYVQSCQDAVVANNSNITSNGTINASYYTAVKGIWFNASSGTTGQVNCNVIRNMGRCLQFSGTSLNKVAKNVMNGNGDYQGFVLALNGVIGDQGHTTNTTHDNEWNGFTGGSAQYAETYTENSNTANTNSRFYVKSGSPFQPTQNYSNNGNPYVTLPAWGIDVKSGLSGENCLALRMMGGDDNSNTNNKNNAMRTAFDVDTTNADVFEALASDTTFYEVYQNETQYRNKQLVYELINKQSIDATHTLNEFYNNNQNSNYQTLTTINDAFANADYQTAQTINSSLTANNLIEEYQKRVNELLIKYINYQSQPVDSNATPFTYKTPVFDGIELAELSTIANSCFDKYGSVITQARVLMNNVSNTLIEFEENCKPEFNQRKKQISNSVASNVNVKLYPNPNKGLMQLDYDLGNSQHATIKLYDINGKLISSYKLDSNKGILQMNEQNLNNGIYFYHILVGEKTIKTDKVVIIK
ncbi:MAG: T9SS type A sorting domain-containing protein [Bacteroidia bacterium]|nr:T9SS type A sorting domain-containing protein [Bacteroidia bacterium]